MKKKICSFALLATAGVGSMFMSACGDPALESISVKDGSIETTLLVGSEEPNWKDLVLNLNYDNDETATATKNEDMTISRIDTSILGTQELVIKYKGLTTTVKIHIVAHEGDLYEYIGYEKPNSFVLYEGNAKDADASVDTEFSVGSHNYKVGDDNPFKFLPKITAINQSGNTVTVTQYTSDVVVKENGEELTGSALESVVAIDNTNSTFDFTPEAVGRTFEITVKPLNYDEDMTYYPITFTVDVVNAWNAYNVADLSRIENNEKSAHIWAEKKQETGIDNTEIDGIVLHQNLEIKKSDLPEGMFHPEGTIEGGQDISGTLIDARSFYTRDIDVNDTFSIYGNYFTISTCNEGDEKDVIPLVKYLTHDGQFGHAAIFSFGGNNNFAPNDAQGRAVINSLSLMGNGSRQTSDEAIAGSLVGILTSAHHTTLENCLTRKFNIHIISDGEWEYPTASDIALTIRNSKMIDSFNTMVYTWATRNTYIENSILKQAGGPLVMATHPYAKEHPEFFANIHLKNTTIENYVGGSEAWFSKTGAAAIISYLKVISGLMENTSESLIGSIDGINSVASLTTNNGAVLNFLTCNIGENTIMQSEPIKSMNTIKDANGELVNEQDMKDQVIASILELAPEMVQMPIFKAGNVYVTLDPGTLSEVEGIPMPIPGGLSLIYVAEGDELGGAPFALISLNDLANDAVYGLVKDKADAMLAEFFNSSYVNMFYNGPCLGSTFELFHTAPQA